MYIRSLAVTILLHDALSLKDKRQILKSLMEKARRKFNIAIAETGYQEQWQRAQIGIVFLSSRCSHLDHIQLKIMNYLEDFFPVEITEIEANDL